MPLLVIMRVSRRDWVLTAGMEAGGRGSSLCPVNGQIEETTKSEVAWIPEPYRRERVGDPGRICMGGEIGPRFFGFLGGENCQRERRGGWKSEKCGRGGGGGEGGEMA